MTYARTAAWLAGALLSSSILATAQLPPSITGFPTPTSDSYPDGITLGPMARHGPPKPPSVSTRSGGLPGTRRRSLPL
jgi:hypothetical protein